MSTRTSAAVYKLSPGDRRFDGWCNAAVRRIRLRPARGFAQGRGQWRYLAREGGVEEEAESEDERGGASVCGETRRRDWVSRAGGARGTRRGPCASAGDAAFRCVMVR